MGGFGSVMLLLDTTAVPPVCSEAFLWLVELQSDKSVISQRGGGVTVCTAPGKKQCNLLQQKLGLWGEVTSTKDRN